MLIGGNAGHTVEILGISMKGKKPDTAKIQDSDFVIKSSRSTTKPLVLPVDTFTQPWKYTLDNWNRNTKVPFKNDLPLDQRTLPQVGDQYPYLTISDFLEDTIIKMPDEFNDELYFVDLPGYGYAKVSKELSAKWGKMIERYLNKSRQLKAVFLLIDIRHEPSDNDRLMYDWVCSNGYEPIIIATKLDKIKRSQLSKHVSMIRKGLGAGADTTIIPFSSTSKQGREQVYAILDENQASLKSE